MSLRGARHERRGNPCDFSPRGRRRAWGNPTEWWIAASFLLALTGLLVVAGVVCFVTSNHRMGINLLLASPIPSVLAVLLVKLATLPIWIFLLIAAIGGSMTGNDYG